MFSYTPAIEAEFLNKEVMIKLNDGELLGFCKLQAHSWAVDREMYWPSREAFLGSNWKPKTQQTWHEGNMG